MSKNKLILGVTLGGSSRLLDNQAKYFRELGYEVYLVSQDHLKERMFCEKEGIIHLPVNIVAEINPIRDIISLFQIFMHFKRVRPDIVNLGTPKMALLGLIAAKILSVKKRIYTCRGLRFETERGIKRIILIFLENLTVRMAQRVIYVSPSLKLAAQHYGVLDKYKSIVIHKGSSNGVNVTLFNQTKINQVKLKSLKEEFNLQNFFVIGFVGRITKDKGVYELVKAFELLYENNPKLRLIMMGHVKCDSTFELRFRSHPGIMHIPFQDNVPLYMSLFDIFVLPSWREGFPNVPIQAAALGIPVIVSNATGCFDSIEDGFNGTIYPVRDCNVLHDVLKLYIDNPELRKKHGSNGIIWADQFNQETIWRGIQNIYELC